MVGSVDVVRLDPLDAGAEVLRSFSGRRVPGGDYRYFPQFLDWPAFGVGDGVAEEVEEGGAEELVGEVEGHLPFTGGSVSFVEDGGDPPLFGEGRERDLYVLEGSNPETRLVHRLSGYTRDLPHGNR